MEPSELAVTKLIILSIVRRIPAITLSQLTGLALDTLYMDYFGFALAFDALTRDQMIAAGIRRDETERDALGRFVTRCDVSERGRVVLETLESRIPLPIRSYLAQESVAWHKDIRLQRQRSAQADPDADGQYQVRLRQHEGTRVLVDLSLSIPDKALARQICDRWQRQPQSMYLGLLTLLTGESIGSAAATAAAAAAGPAGPADLAEWTAADRSGEPDRRAAEPAGAVGPAQAWLEPMPQEQSLAADL